MSSTTDKPEEMRRWMTDIQRIPLGPVSVSLALDLSHLATFIAALLGGPVIGGLLAPRTGYLLLFVLDATGALPLIERASRPLVVGLLGLPAKAADAFLVGFLRRDYGAAGFFLLRRTGTALPAKG